MASLLFGAAAAGATSLGTSSLIAAGTSIAGPALSAGTVAAGAGIGSTLLGILQGVATAASVIGTIQAASADSTTALQQATQTDLEAGQSQVSTENQNTELKRQLVKVLGENDVAIAASGIDLSGGIEAQQRNRAQQDTVDQLSISQKDDDMRRALLKARANGYRAQASSYQSGGLLKALGETADFGIDLAHRG